MPRILKLFLLSLFFILKTEGVFAQDSLRKKIQHMIGVGLDYTPYSKGFLFHRNATVEYEMPEYHFFYRLLFLNENKKHSTSLHFGIHDRKGTYYYSESFKIGYVYEKGIFDLRRIEIGIFELARLGKHKNFNLGGGFIFGKTLYTNGTIYHDETLAGVSKSSIKKAESISSKLYFSLNIEISQAFKIIRKHFIVLGLRQSIETPDFGGAAPNFTHHAFLAYNIR
ncbi:MAG: hypothetical protein Q7W45_06315 [Bacteroidota bacterium]|nr:hypothetical protein [Bacteroidota bacterium]MDP3145063.1 hypothetical protein [Bacteroidota bacterium]MDP3556095.1 hypothetical protein [Bacteroidota bacterium]